MITSYNLSLKITNDFCIYTAFFDTNIFNDNLYIKIRVYQLDCNSRSNPVESSDDGRRNRSNFLEKQRKRKETRSSQIPKSFPKIAQDVNYSAITSELSRIPPIKPRENNALITRDIITLLRAF